MEYVRPKPDALDFDGMEADFLRSGNSPSCKVTRVKPQSGTSSTVNRARSELIQEGKEPFQDNDTVADPPLLEAEQATSSEGIHGILGDIQEREIVAPTSAPNIEATSVMGFPTAAHRKMSKFSLARKRAATATETLEGRLELPGSQQIRTNSRRGEAESNLDEGSEAESISTRQAEGERRSEGESSLRAQANPGHNLDTQAEGEKQGAMQKMLAVGEEQDESKAKAAIDAENRAKLLSMPSEEVSEAQKQIQGSLSAATIAFLQKRGAAKGAPDSISTNSAASEGVSFSRSTTTCTSSLQNGAPPTSRAYMEKQAGTGAGAGSGGEGLASRARFSLEGKLLGFASSTDVTAAVLSRDPIRTSGEEGYMLREACVLARSSQPAQRAAACRLIAAVIVQAAPTWLDACSSDPKPVPSENGSKPNLYWRDVWSHALSPVNVTFALRVALDESSPAVVTAAAQGIAALLNGTSGIDTGLLALLPPGSPRLPLQYLQRPHALGIWEAFPLQATNCAPESEQEADEVAVAQINPGAGLVQMQVLPRLCYILEALQPPGAFLPSVTALQSLAATSKDAAVAVCSTPRLVSTLLSFLDLHGPGEAGDLVIAAKFAARVEVLQLLKSLCRADKSLAQFLMTQGLDRHVKRFLIGGPLPEQPTHHQAANLQMVSLEIWRICADHGIFVLSLDGMYPVLCHAFVCPNWESLAADMEGQQTCRFGESAYLQDSAATWAVATSLLRQQSSAVVSSQCAYALAREALAWLQPFALHGLIHVLEDEELAAICSSKEATIPEFATTAFAAVLGFLAEYCTQGGPQAAKIRESAAQSINYLLKRTAVIATLSGLLLNSMDALLLGRQETRRRSLSQSTREGIVSAGLLYALLNLDAALAATTNCKPDSHTGVWVTLGTALADKVIAAVRASPVTPVVIHPHELVLLQTMLPAYRLFTSILEQLQTGAFQDQNSLSQGAESRLQQAALALPVLLPPGCEALALAALTYAFSATPAQRTLDTASRGLNQQQGEIRMPSTTENQKQGEISMSSATENQKQGEIRMPSATECRKALLEGYAAASLGLVPEETGGNLIGTTKPPKDAVAVSASGGELVEGIESALPLRKDWLFLGPATLVEEQKRNGGDLGGAPIATIPEEGPAPEAVVERQPKSLQAQSVGIVLAYILGLELQQQDESMINQIPTGLKLRGILNLMFHPDASAEGEEPWYDPLARCSTAALVELYARHWPSPSSRHATNTAAGTRHATSLLDMSQGKSSLPASNKAPSTKEASRADIGNHAESNSKLPCGIEKSCRKESDVTVSSIDLMEPLEPVNLGVSSKAQSSNSEAHSSKAPGSKGSSSNDATIAASSADPSSSAAVDKVTRDKETGSRSSAAVDKVTRDKETGPRSSAAVDHVTRDKDSSTADDTSISREDVAAWAHTFATSSFGDQVFAKCLAIFLRQAVAPELQESLLETLAEGGALHLLPELQDAIGTGYLHDGPISSVRLADLYSHMLISGRLQKATEDKTMIPEVAVHTLQQFMLAGVSEGSISPGVLVDKQRQLLQQLLQKGSDEVSQSFFRCSGKAHLQLLDMARDSCKGDSTLLRQIAAYVQK